MFWKLPRFLGTMRSSGLNPEFHVGPLTGQAPAWIPDLCFAASGTTRVSTKMGDHMTTSGFAIKIALALLGSFLGAYVGQELVGGGAFGWTVTGAIVAAFCFPLFQALLAWRQSRR